MNQVLATAKYVSDHSESVRLNKRRLKKFCKSFNRSDAKHWLSESPFDFSRLAKDEEKMNFLFVYSTTGFCYWGDPPWSVEYRGQNHQGSFGMIAALGRAVEAGVPLLDPRYRARMGREELEEVLDGNITIPMLEDRLRFIRESGSVLMGRYGGLMSTLVQSGGGDVSVLLGQLVKQFSSFEDHSLYDGREICFHKKAQLFVSDLYQLFGESDGVVSAT